MHYPNNTVGSSSFNDETAVSSTAKPLEDEDPQTASQEMDTLCDGNARELPFTEGYKGPRHIPFHGARSVKYGRIHAIRLRKSVFWVGPHWYFSIIMLSFVIFVGCLFVYSVALTAGAVHVVCGMLVTFLTTVAFLQCALSDPGILRDSPGNPAQSPPVQLLPSSGRRECASCAIVQPKGSLHCEYCRVCIAGYDHHCPWMSKCIGKGNAHHFYTFICVALSSLLYIVVAAIMATGPRPERPKPH